MNERTMIYHQIHRKLQEESKFGFHMMTLRYKWNNQAAALREKHRAKSGPRMVIWEATRGSGDGSFCQSGYLLQTTDSGWFQQRSNLLKDIRKL